jgi:hypothetical protein
MPHVHLFFPKETAVSSASKSTVFALDFFHSLFGFRREGDVGGVDPSADLAASSRDLFFPVEVFMLFDGDGFILQRQRVFTRIRSGAALEASSGSASGSLAQDAVVVCSSGYVLARSISTDFECGGWKTLRVSASIYKSTGGSATTRWICFNS